MGSADCEISFTNGVANEERKERETMKRRNLVMTTSGVLLVACFGAVVTGPRVLEGTSQNKLFGPKTTVSAIAEINVNKIL